MAPEIQGDTPEAIAFELLKVVAFNEKNGLTDGTKGLDRKWILDTYAECLVAVKNQRVTS